ncbi:hypothetical protein PENTCL1PPCAC_12456, partial [Pristionchus entomophagus]
IGSDNMDSMADDHLIEEGRENEEISWKNSRSEFEKRDDNSAPSAMHECKICARVFKFKTSLIAHTSVAHSIFFHQISRCIKANKFPCDICSYRSATLAALATHICMHTGDRPHKCTIGECSEAFANASLLKNHQRVVHKVKPFECSICGEKFDMITQLTRHKKGH